MRSLILVFCMMVACVMGSSAHAALSNENNPHLMCVPLGSPSADATVLAGASVGKSLVVTSARLLNAGIIAASDTDFVVLELRKGATVVASLDTRTAGQGAVAANTSKAMVLASAAAATMASGSVLSVVYNETDAGTNVALTGAVLCFDYVVK